MSINSINGIGNSFNMMPADPIKPETRQKLKELGIEDKSIRTETQAQNKIEQKVAQIQKEIQERLQADAATMAQNTQNVQPQNAPNVNNPEKVDGIGNAERIKQPEGIDQQQNIQNKQTQNEEMKAFAGSNSIQQNIQDNEPFKVSGDITALYNKLKLGLI